MGAQRWVGGSRETENGGEIESVERGRRGVEGGREDTRRGRGHREAGGDGGQRWRPNARPPATPGFQCGSWAGNASHSHSQDQAIILLGALLKYPMWPERRATRIPSLRCSKLPQGSATDLGSSSSMWHPRPWAIGPASPPPAHTLSPGKPRLSPQASPDS